VIVPLALSGVWPFALIICSGQRPSLSSETMRRLRCRSKVCLRLVAFVESLPASEFFQLSWKPY
jgi:hypothetical protein